MVKDIKTDVSLIAYCGLYCGACPSYLKERCPGCRDNVKATWCQIRKCCEENKFQSCADCTKVEPDDCKKYNTFFSKVIGFVLNSDRAACISRIKEIGYEPFAVEMAGNRKITIKRR